MLQLLFTFVEPEVIRVEPRLGPAGGHTSVTIFGTNLLGEMRCDFDGISVLSGAMACTRTANTLPV